MIYHAACADGFCAAAILWDALVEHSDVSEVVTIPAHYGQPLPSNLDANDVVYLVDFSYKRDVMIELCSIAKYVYVLDHHKTAKEELAQLKLTNATIIFDMDRSGAMLTFDFVQCMRHSLIHQLTDILPKSHPEIIPKLVSYVQDRDLWQFKLPHSKEISAYLQSIPFDLRDWVAMMKAIEINSVFRSYVTEGTAILRYQQMQTYSAVNKAVNINFPLAPGANHGMPVKIVNTTVNRSEVGDDLCVNHEIPFAVTWFYRSDGKFQYSLRSRSGYDVSRVAKAYGGGGHPAAAGFESDVLIEGT
ncbi:MAG: DHHA1 domain-containing protein [Euryarchaeota archaeon]|nr:DHHA1 domain-containing protein [Euryarchaeota archaeon]